MSKQKIFGKIFRSLPVAMIIISCLGGFYGAYKDMVSYATPVILLIISILYFVGLKMGENYDS